MDEIVFVCEMLNEMQDLGGLTLYVVIWLVAEKVTKKRGDWNFGLL